MALVVTDYQFVLSKRMSAKEDIYKPDVIFQLHLPPNSMLYSPRQANVTTPTFGGAHIDYAAQTLGDLTVSITTGVGMAFSTTEDGGAITSKGEARSRALRKFFENASHKLESGSYRMEFHSDTRSYHFQIVPKSISFTIESSGPSRIGGADMEISAAVVRDLKKGVGLFSAVNDFLDSAKSAIGQVAGFVQQAFVFAEKAMNTAGGAIGAIQSVIRSGEVLVNAVRGVGVGAAGLKGVGVDAWDEWKDLITVAKVALREIQDDVVPGPMPQTVSSIDASCDSFGVCLKAVDGEQSTLPPSAKACGKGTSSSSFDDGSEGFLPKTTPAGGAFEAVKDDLDKFKGWVPYFPGIDETLIGISQKVFGTPDKWVTIAIINGLSSAFPGQQIGGSALKIPVASGGLPFGMSLLPDAQATKRMIDEKFFYRDIALASASDKTGHRELCDIRINESSFRDILTVTGPENYAQRYRHIVFPTELGENPSYPAVGVYRGIGRKGLIATRHLTRETARTQLLSDPRTMAVEVTAYRRDGDSVIVAFDAQTVSATVSALEVR